MPTPDGPQFEPKLFDDSKFAVERPPSLDKWLDHPDVAYHGTFRGDWNYGPVAHFGTLEQASQRARHVMPDLQRSPFNRASYFDHSVSEHSDLPDDDEWDGTYEGRIHARRINKADISEFGPQVNKIIDSKTMSSRNNDKPRLGVSDSDANVIDAAYRLHEGYEEWETPKSVTGSINTPEEIPRSRMGSYGDSAGWDVKRLQSRNPDTARVAVRGVRLMKQGKAIPYHNAAEGDTKRHENVSYLAPSSAVGGTYENMILSHPGATAGEKEYASQRISKELDGTVEPSSPRSRREYVQGDLFDIPKMTKKFLHGVTQDGLAETAQNWNTPRIRFKIVNGELM